MRTILLVVGIALIAVPSQGRAAEPIPLLIVDGQNNHDWARATTILTAILKRDGLFRVDVSTTPPAKAAAAAWETWRPEFSRYKVVLVNFNGGDKANGTRWPREVEKSLEDYVAGGGGLVVYHAANNAFLKWPAYNEMIGLGWRDKSFGPSLIVSPDEKVVVVPRGEGRNPGHGPEHDFVVSVLDREHPITRDMPRRWLHPHEQLTHGQHGPGPEHGMHVLTYAWSKDTKENEVMDWTVPYGKGRVYVTLLGHLWPAGPDTAMRCTGFQTLMIRGCQWAAGGEVSYRIPDDFPTETQIRLRGG